MLERQVASHGQSVSLRKAVAVNGNADATLQAFVRGATQEELAGGVDQSTSTVLISPLALAASGFDGAPKRLDRITISGRLRTIELVNTVTITGVAVRHELTVK